MSDKSQLEEERYKILSGISHLSKDYYDGELSESEFREELSYLKSKLREIEAELLKKELSEVAEEEIEEFENQDCDKTIRPDYLEDDLIDFIDHYPYPGNTMSP